MTTTGTLTNTARPAADGGRALSLAVAGYIIGIATLEWVNVAVLCRGDPKWGYGCGFPELFVFGALVVFAPAFLASLLTARACAPMEWRGRLYRIASAATVLVALLAETLQGYDVVSLVFAAGVAANLVRGAGWWLIPDNAMGAGQPGYTLHDGLRPRGLRG